MKLSGLTKLKFYFSLAYYNLISIFECQNYQLKILLNEFSYLFSTLGWKPLVAGNKPKFLLKTKFGNFFIRDIVWDLKVASPAFERPDIDELLHRMEESFKQGHDVVFLDIGAQFGKYSIAVGTHFRNQSQKLSILAFDPDSENFGMLNKNIKLNNLLKVKTFKIALSDKTTTKSFYYYEPQKIIVSFPTDRKIKIHTTTLDQFQKYLGKKENTDIYMKLDIEGHEVPALLGSKKVIKTYPNITILIEDSVGYTSQKLLEYLRKNGQFLLKKTTYNSFWKLNS